VAEQAARVASQAQDVASAASAAVSAPVAPVAVAASEPAAVASEPAPAKKKAEAPKPEANSDEAWVDQLPANAYVVQLAAMDTQEDMRSSNAATRRMPMRASCVRNKRIRASGITFWWLALLKTNLKPMPLCNLTLC